MTFDKISEQIYVCFFDGEGRDELSRLFDQWNDIEYLCNFFTTHKGDLSYFGASIEQAVKDTLEDSEELESQLLEVDSSMDFDLFFKPLHNQQYCEVELGKNKAKLSYRPRHASWLRIYAIRVDRNLYVITGGAIKLTETMEERPHTKAELTKIERVRNFLKDQGVFDCESLEDYLKE